MADSGSRLSLATRSGVVEPRENCVTEDLAQHDSTGTGPAGVSVDAEWVGGVAVVHVRGEVDMGTVAAIDLELVSVLAEVPPAVVMDLSGTTFFASSGLQTLAELQGRAVRSGFDLRVVAPTHRIRRPIEITGLDAVLNLHDTVADALARIPRQPR
jgi:anti-sigma B factor antagonist